MIRRLRVFARPAPIVSEEERESVAQYVSAIRLLLEEERAVASRFRRVLAQSKEGRSAPTYEWWVLVAAGYFREHARELARRFWGLPTPACATRIRSSWGEYYSALVACFVTASAAIVGAEIGAPWVEWMADEYEFSKLGQAYGRAYKRAWHKTQHLAKRLEIDLNQTAAPN